MTNYKSIAIDYIKAHWELWYCEENQTIQYRPIDKSNEWQKVDSGFVKAIHADLRNNGLSISEQSIREAISEIAVNKTDDGNDISLIKQYVSTCFETRYNTIKNHVEYRLFEDKSKWKRLTDHEVNSLWVQMREMGFKLNKDTLWTLFESDFSENVNPLQDYFLSLNNDTTDNPIEKLAKTINVKNDKHWKNYLTKWLVASVANVFELESCTNHTMLVLCGEQGTYKTTWLNNLNPSKLDKDYFFTGNLNIESSDCNTYLAEKFIINMDDQMRDLLTKHGSETIKNVITKNYVTYRKPYAHAPIDVPRIANFVGSINGEDFLNDPTGNRRFLPFSIESIDIDAMRKIDIDAVWKQAFDLYKSGYQYYFTKDDIVELAEHNKQFEQSSIEEELLLRYYAPVSEYDLSACFVQTADIVNTLTLATASRLNNNRIYDSLKKNGFIPRRKVVQKGGKAVNGYYVRILRTIGAQQDYEVVEEEELF